MAPGLGQSTQGTHLGRRVSAGGMAKLAGEWLVMGGLDHFYPFFIFPETVGTLIPTDMFIVFRGVDTTRWLCAKYLWFIDMVMV